MCCGGKTLPPSEPRRTSARHRFWANIYFQLVISASTEAWGLRTRHIHSLGLLGGLSFGIQAPVNKSKCSSALEVRDDVLVEILAPNLFLMYKKNHFVVRFPER